MKSNFIIILFLISALSCNNSVQKTELQIEQQALQEIMQVERKFAVSFQRKELEMIDSILSDKYQLTFPNGKVMTKKEIMSDFRNDQIEFELLSYKQTDFRLFENIGVLKGYANVNAKVGGKKFNGWYQGITIMRRKEDDWQRVEDHFGLTDFKPTEK